MGQWLLTPEDKSKIEGAIRTLEKDVTNNPIIKEALRLLGGTIVT